MVTMYILLHCISVLYKCYVFLLHYITALLTLFLFFFGCFFVVFSLLLFVVFGRVRLQNHFFYHSSLEGGGPFLYQLFTSVFTNC